jgi:hypothetical protein
MRLTRYLRASPRTQVILWHQHGWANSVAARDGGFLYILYCVTDNTGWLFKSCLFFLMIAPVPATSE